MGRLIDGAIQPMLLANYILERKDTFVKVFEKGDNDFLFAMLMDYFDSQPTAYDPDKVVEQLEERTAFLKDCTKYGNKTADQQSKSYDTMMMYEVMDLVDDLLEIVKAGVSDGN